MYAAVIAFPIDKRTMKTFKHSGDMGDIIFSLPTIAALNGGLLYLDPDGGESSPLVKWADQTRTKFNQKLIEQLTPFLELQDGVIKVLPWEGQLVDYDLDKFRQHIRFNNLSISHLEAFGLDHAYANLSWLKFPTKRVLPKPLLISRSARYHGNDAFWIGLLPKIKSRALFIGYPKEHDIFEYTFGHKIEYYPTPTILDLIETIYSSEQIFCNQGFSHAIAEGLAHPLVCEVERLYPAAIFQNKSSSQYA